jgi:deazaflavin-dependent oxidoreductase (nitroreductase family)
MGGRVQGGEILLLTTKGRRSGGTHTNPLMFVRDGESFVVIACNAGQQRHPAWYWNVTSKPGVDIQIGPRRISTEARRATPEERGRLRPGDRDAVSGVRQVSE